MHERAAARDLLDAQPLKMADNRTTPLLKALDKLDVLVNDLSEAVDRDDVAVLTAGGHHKHLSDFLHRLIFITENLRDATGTREEQH